MEENEFREALQHTMTEVPQPPPMSLETTLAAGRRARVRRGVVWTGAAFVATGALVIAGVAGVRWLPRQEATAAAPPLPASTAPSVVATGAPGASATASVATPDPKGSTPQGDATQRSGPQYEQGARLLQLVISVVPAGYTVLPDNGEGTNTQPPNRYHQATSEGDGYWRYLAETGIAQGDRTGRLLVEVHTKGNHLATEPCQLAQEFWSMKGDCQVATVGTATVGVVVKPDPRDTRLDQWAAYRYPDGTVVYVAQSRYLNAAYDGGPSALVTLPYTVQQLAALAVDQRFHLE